MTGLLVHEWIATHGGSENVLEVLADSYPHVDVLCLWRDSPERLASRRVHETWMARRQGLRTRKALALPLMPATWRGVDLSEYEWLLVSSHAFAHQVASNPTAPDMVHVYVHTPARYVWAPELDARKVSPALAPARAALRRLDRRRVGGEGTSFAANSAFVASRIADAWGKDATVIYPPVEVTALQSGGSWGNRLDEADSVTYAGLPDTFVLGASRFVQYKRVGLAIRVGELLDLPVVIAGHGDEADSLREAAARASVPVTVIIRPSDNLLRALMERASLYVFPPVEDFGIMPVEAAALGTPTLVNRIGGARESVEKIDSGAAIDFDDESEVRVAAKRLIDDPNPSMREHARYFDRTRFAREVEDWRSDSVVQSASRSIR